MKHNCPMCGEPWNDDVCTTCGWYEGKQARYSGSDRPAPHAALQQARAVITEVLQTNGGPIDGDDGHEYVMVRRDAFDVLATLAAQPPLSTQHDQARALLADWQAEDQDAPATETPQSPRMRCREGAASPSKEMDVIP